MQRMNPVTIPAKTTMAERVWMQLAAEIVSGGVAEGLRLDEVEQSQRLGVSRTPLRESLRQLAALGLVENRPHRGVVVAEGVGGSVFEVLAELEAACARGAAQRLSPEQRAELKGLALDEDLLTDWIHQACGNSVLRGLLGTLWDPLVAGKSEKASAEILAALEALRNGVADGDDVAAAEAARAYVQLWRKKVLGE